MRKDVIKISSNLPGKIAVKVPYNPVYIKRPKGMKGYKWNPEEKCWIFPQSENVVGRLFDLFKSENVWIDPSLKRCKKDISIFEDLRKEMVTRKYSPKTIKAYIHYNENFLKFVSKAPKCITEKDIKDYLFYLVKDRKVATSTLNSAINALKFQYGTILKRGFSYEIKRPRKDKKLPAVLSQQEISKLLSVISNIKHGAILTLIYSAGLRVSEVVKLKPKDIDSERKLVFIKGAKGRKDRYTLLSDITLKRLRNYWKKYKPKNWLFQSQDKEKHITT